MDLPHLREMRRRAVLTQQQLAEKSGVARDTISKLESGHRRAYPTTVQKLAAALAVAPQALVGGVEYLDEEVREERQEEQPEKKRRRAGF
ncbi:XRE family transcriptional regulator [Rubrobacter taiwanensis]|uniref:XRE family transcriptional regulator n=1 Tax=Rubrobacter taiwanensis TaxID=185139 RepID=A0A4R1BRI7_9ACTN|nr:helix-turn-helix transcriptional regulator [Rubrobacter taiwanensis]TCJ19937.1 XRE family transcriptional regulator [Rubrobacter taiwanensis]